MFKHISKILLLIFVMSFVFSSCSKDELTAPLELTAKGLDNTICVHNGGGITDDTDDEEDEDGITDDTDDEEDEDSNNRRAGSGK